MDDPRTDEQKFDDMTRYGTCELHGTPRTVQLITERNATTADLLCLECGLPAEPVSAMNDRAHAIAKHILDTDLVTYGHVVETAEVYGSPRAWCRDCDWRWRP